MRIAQEEREPARAREGSWSALVALAATWRRRHRERRALARDLAFMADETLADHGLSREEARAEIAKPFWCD